MGGTDPIDAAIARLPRRARPRRSTAGASGWAGHAARAVLVIGVVATFVACVRVDPADDADLLGPALVFSVAGVAAGILFAIGRDARGQPERPWSTAWSLFALWIFLAMFSFLGDPRDLVADWLMPVLAMLLVMEGPLLAGYLVTREIGRARTRVVQDAWVPAVHIEPAELLAATRRWTAPSILRAYELSDTGRRQLADDTDVLQRHGYRCLAVAERKTIPGAATIAANLALFMVGFGAPDQPVDLRALFVRPDAIADAAAHT